MAVPSATATPEILAPSEPADRVSILYDHVLPLAFYFIAYTLLTWPAMRSFSTAFLGAYDDLYVYVWGLWWFDKAATELHQSPFFTMWLHYPHGTTLIGHTVGPFNGLLAIPLLRVTSMVQAYNAVVVIGFVASGWTMYLLARAVSGSRSGALLAGFLFTFSAYHFAQATCHLQLSTLQGVPLCLLGLLRLFQRPSLTRAVLAAGAVLLVALTELYYVLYCAIAGGLMYVAFARETRAPLFALRRPYVVPLLVFLVLAAAASLQIFLMMIANQRDPFYGGHSAVMYSADLFAAFIPGGHWRFGSWTEGYWGRFYAGWLETSVYLGWGALLLAVVAWRRRARPAAPAIVWCALTAVVFFVLSLGPVLWVWGYKTGVPMPYALMERLIPSFKVTGMPIRMMMMASLAVAVLAACGWAQLARVAPSPKRVGVMAALGALIVFETWPRPTLLSPPDVPAWVHALKALPGSGGIIDATTHPAYSLYYQTIHEKPFAFGYISREPSSVATNKLRKRLALRQGDFDALRDQWRFEYVIVAATAAVVPSPRLELAYADDAVKIYRLGPVVPLLSRER